MGMGKKKKSTIILALIAVAVIACIIFLIENPWFFKLEYETTDKTDYSKCLRLVDDMSGVTECFPKRSRLTQKMQRLKPTTISEAGL